MSVKIYRENQVAVNRENRLYQSMTRRGRPPKFPKEARPDWARRLADLREERGLNQQELAERLGGIAQQTVGGYETGASEPNLAMFQRLAAFYNVNVTWLVFGFGNPRDEEAPGADAPERRKHDQLFTFAFVRVANLLEEEGIKADLPYLGRLATKMLRSTKGIESDGDAQEAIRRAIDVERAPIRK